jgi:hypothetical protein
MYLFGRKNDTIRAGTNDNECQKFESAISLLGTLRGLKKGK